MNLKQATRRLFFKSIDSELAYQRQAIDLLLKSLSLNEKEMALQSRILLSYINTFDGLNKEAGLAVPFPEKIVIKTTI
jgi:hypothetical protein